MAKLLVSIAGIVVAIEFRHGEVPSRLIVTAGLGVLGSTTQHQVDVEVTELFAPVRHQVVAQVAILVHVVTQHTLLPDLLDCATGSDCIVALGRIAIDTHAVAQPPPVEQIPLHVEVAGETLGIIGHLVLVDNPVGVVTLVPGLELVTEHAIARSVLVQVVTHVIAGSPVIGSIQGTSTTGAVESGTSQGLHGAGITVSGVGAEGEAAHLLLTVEAEGRLGVARGGNDTVLIVE